MTFINKTNRLLQIPAFLTLILLYTSNIQAQNIDSLASINTLATLPDKTIARLEKTYDNINGKIDKQTLKYIKRLEKQEAKLRRKLAKADPAAAKALFDHTQAPYEQYKIIYKTR